MTKVSVYIDDEVWSSFRKQVFQKYGNLRKLSSEVEALLKESTVDNAVASAFQNLGIEVKSTISSGEIKAVRPSCQGNSSEVMVREMRRKRIEALSGH
jgi:hypothetical protein